MTERIEIMNGIRNEGKISYELYFGDKEATLIITSEFGIQSIMLDKNGLLLLSERLKVVAENMKDHVFKKV